MRLRTATGAGVSVLVGLALLVSLLIGTGPAAAATGTPWSAEHGTATATGTFTVTAESSPLPSRRVNLTGTLSNTSADCYTLQWFITYDFVPRWFDITTVCGRNQVQVQSSAVASFPTTGISVRVCRTGGDCGRTTRLL